MKKAFVVFLLFTLSLCVPTQGIKAQYKLDFKINNLPDTIKTVYLLKYFGDKLQYADTTEIKSGKATFLKKNYPGGMYAFYTGASYFEFVISDQDKNISIETTNNNFIKDMKIIKSDENKIFYEYINFIGSKRPISEQLVKEREALDQKIITEIEDDITEIEDDEWYTVYESKDGSLKLQVKFEISQNLCGQNSPTKFLYRYKGNLENVENYGNWELDYLDCNDVKYTMTGYAPLSSNCKNMSGIEEMEEFNMDEREESLTAKKLIEIRPNVGNANEYFSLPIKESLDPKKYSVKVKAINDQLIALDKEVKQFQKDIVKKHKGKLISKILNMSVEIEIPTETPDSLKGLYLRDHFWDNIDLTDERLARTPIFSSKVEYYFKNLVYQIPDSIVKQASFIIDQVKDSTDMMKFLLNYVHVNYETSNIMGMDGVYVGMSLKYYCPPNKNKAWWYPEQNLADRCEKAMTWEPLLLGKVAPNLRLADTTEKKWINVHELPNKHKVLIFWDPDCGHCKKEIPKLLKVYHELLDKKQDVAFIGIGTELDNEKWRKMIKEKNIDFINLSDFPDANKNAAQYVYEMRVTDYPSLNFRKTYDLFSTPQIYLLDENNKIVAKRLDANNLARILERRLDITLDYKEEPKDDKKKDTDK